MGNEGSEALSVLKVVFPCLYSKGTFIGCSCLGLWEEIPINKLRERLCQR
jgi:hypothetical protein